MYSFEHIFYTSDAKCAQDFRLTVLACVRVQLTVEVVPKLVPVSVIVPPPFVANDDAARLVTVGAPTLTRERKQTVKRGAHTHTLT